MNWNVGRPTLVILLLLLDLLLINNILQNKKQEVLGVKTETKKTSKPLRPKTSPPVLSIELANKKYPSLTPSGRPTPSLTPAPIPTNTRADIPGIPVHQSESTLNENSASMTLSTQSQSISIVNSPSLINQINSFRSSKGMAAVSENTETCAFANTRASEIVSNFNHDGFTNRVNSNSLPYPTYSSVAENIAMNGEENQVVPGWINSQGHAENLLKDVPFGCVRSNGNYYAFEVWKP